MGKWTHARLFDPVSAFPLLLCIVCHQHTWATKERQDSKTVSFALLPSIETTANQKSVISKHWKVVHRENVSFLDPCRTLLEATEWKLAFGKLDLLCDFRTTLLTLGIGGNLINYMQYLWHWVLDYLINILDCFQTYLPTFYIFFFKNCLNREKISTVYFSHSSSANT